jgi:hypothetical protein
LYEKCALVGFEQPVLLLRREPVHLPLRSFGLDPPGRQGDDDANEDAADDERQYGPSIIDHSRSLRHVLAFPSDPHSNRDIPKHVRLCVFLVRDLSLSSRFATENVMTCENTTILPHGIQRSESEMNEEELLQLRRGVEAQFSWVLKHNGDEELADLLRSERERLSGIINPPQSHNAPTLEPGNCGSRCTELSPNLGDGRDQAAA